MHATTYFILAWLCARCFRHLARLRSTLPLGCVVFSSLYGLSDEIHQAFVPGRSPEWGDWLADTAGALIYAWFMHRQRWPMGT